MVTLFACFGVPKRSIRPQQWIRTSFACRHTIWTSCIRRISRLDLFEYGRHAVMDATPCIMLQLLKKPEYVRMPCNVFAPPVAR